MNELLALVLNTDTLLNLTVFVFIGLMIWLYGKDSTKANTGEGEDVYDEHSTG